MTRRTRILTAMVAVVAFVLSGLGLLVNATEVHAAGNAVTFTSQGCTTWVVPAGVGRVLIQATGAAGSSPGGSSGGRGDGYSAVLSGLSVGNNLYVCVDAGGASGGGTGGGASGVSLGADFSQPVLVAGGGGGGGRFGGNGGNAGIPVAQAGDGSGNASAHNFAGGGGGGNNTVLSGGAGGSGAFCGTTGSSGSAFASNGPGKGGQGAPSASCGPGQDGGGGGGGYYGGGGGGSGGNAAGGGGGSDFCADIYPGGTSIAGCTVSSGAGTQTSAGSASGNAQVIITWPATITTLQTSPSQPVFGLQVQLTATVVGSDDGGTVAFSSDASPIAGCSAQPLNGSGQATCTTTSLAIGPHSILAAYSGDGNVLGSQGTGSLSVTPAPLTVTADNQNSTYGGTLPALTASFATLSGGDTTASEQAKTSCAVTPLAPTNAGSYPINCTTTDPNYTITSVPGTLTIGPAPLTVTADNQSSTYGGTLPALTASFIGLAGGDTTSSEQAKTICAATPATPTNAGNYPINCSTTDANYSITPVAGTLTIGQALLTVTADNQNATYGGTLTALTAGYSGLVGGDTTTSEQAKTSCAATPATPVNAGNYPISCTTTDPNYSITPVAGTLTIGQASLTVTADNKSITYGGTLPALTASFSGLTGGDTTSTEQAKTSCAATPAAPVNAGNYPINCSTSDPNYSIGAVAGTLTIGQAPLTVTANSPTVTYGAALPAVTASFSGLTGGDTTSSEQAKTTCAATPPAPVNAGKYPINCTTVDANYSITALTGTLTIGRAPLTVTADNKSITYGSALPALTASFSGLVGGDTIAGEQAKTSCAATPTTPSNAGNYPITCTTTDPNYSITPVGGTLAIKQALLTVTANNQSFVFGGSLPALTASFSGLTGGDTTVSEQAKTNCAATPPAPVNAGNYPVNCTTTDPNYNITPVAGTLTIKQATQTIVFAALANRTYGSAPFTVSATASSGLAITFSAGPGTVCAASGPNGATISLVGAGLCTVTANQAGNANFLAAPSVARSFSVNYPPLYLVTSVTSSPAGEVKTGSTVTTTLVLGNHTSSTQTVTLNVTLRYTGSKGSYCVTIPLTIRLNAGQTVSQTERFTITKQFPRGSYAVSATARDRSGDTASSSATFTVS